MSLLRYEPSGTKDAQSIAKEYFSGSTEEGMREDIRRLKLYPEGLNKSFNNEVICQCDGTAQSIQACLARTEIASNELKDNNTANAVLLAAQKECAKDAQNNLLNKISAIIPNKAIIQASNDEEKQKLFGILNQAFSAHNDFSPMAACKIKGGIDNWTIGKLLCLPPHLRKESFIINNASESDKNITWGFVTSKLRSVGLDITAELPDDLREEYLATFKK